MQEEPIDPQDVEVRFRPVFGIAPTTYVPVLYIIALALLLFGLLVLPGLVNPGSQLTVTSTPSGASVSVDGIRADATPASIFVAAGDRTVTVVLPGFGGSTESISVERRLIGSLFLPKRQSLHVSLEPSQTGVELIRDFAHWSLAGEASGQYQFPPVARTLGRVLGATPGTSSDLIWADFYRAALPQVGSEALLNDLLAGSIAVGSESGIATPGALTQALQAAARAATSNERLPEQLDRVLTSDRRSLMEQSQWYGTTPGLDSTIVLPLPGVELATLPGVDTTLIRVPAMELLISPDVRATRGGSIPRSVSTDGFLLSTTEVTIGEYLAFLDYAPQWAPDRRDQLIEDGLADQDYLLTLATGPDQLDLPITGVSWHAAEAYVQWASSQLAGINARLPTETEWDIAVALLDPQEGHFATSETAGPRSVSLGSPTSGYDMMGNVWEWTDTWYAPYSAYYPDSAASGGAHKVVRGGGWQTTAREFLIADRGSMAPDWCSPYVGFRILYIDE